MTGDVEAFYTNINTDTIDASMKALMTGSRIPRKRAIAIAKLVRIVTHKNLFIVNGYHDRQTSGLAIGSPCFSTVANLSLARKEKKFNVNREGILAYTRYIDDIFMLIEASNVVNVRRLLQEVSEEVALLKIKLNIGRHAVYLDVEIEKHGFGYRYKPYSKPGSQRAFLPWSSAHPTHTKKEFVLEETTCLALLSSEEATFTNVVRKFRVDLVRRGYPERAVAAWTNRILWGWRFAQIFEIPTKEIVPASDTLRIPTIYNPIWENINLRRVFDVVLDEWRGTWDSESPNLPHRTLSLSQSRGTKVMDLLSAWNKETLWEDLEDIGE